MNRAEAIKIMESIKEECGKWEECKGCPFEITYADGENECVLDTLESPCEIDYKKIMLEDDEQ